MTDNLKHLDNFERGSCGWGAFAVQDYYDGGFTPAEETHAGILSIWKDIESVQNFTYAGLPGIAFEQRHKLFRETDCPTHEIWWINRGETPSWKQSVACFDSVYTYGPTAFAFNFQHIFNSAGNPITGFEPAR